MVCKYCGDDKDEKEFEVANIIKGKVYKRKKCKACKQLTQNQRRYKIRDWLTQFKQGKKCKDCGFSDHRALSFHHRDPSQKSYNVCSMTGWSVEAIKVEIEKCDILCCNCHMIHEHEVRKFS